MADEEFHPKRRTGRRRRAAHGASGEAGASARDALHGGPSIDLDNYAPAYFTFIANKLARGASAGYLALYGVGIETWRVLVMLAIQPRVTAQQVVQLIGMDKASVSRTLKSMHGDGLVRFESDPLDGRLRYALFTPKGRALHDRIRRFALLREQAALSVLSPAEVEVLRDLLRRVHANLPAVEAASAEFMKRERKALGLPADGPALRRRGRGRQPD